MNEAEKIAEGLKLFAEGFGEFMEKASEKIIEIAKAIKKTLDKIEKQAALNYAKNSDDKYIAKAYKIYTESKNKRIRQKQFKKMKHYMYERRCTLAKRC